MEESTSNKPLSLAENFQKYFTVHYARTPEEKYDGYHIRYRVYCEEFGYEDATAFPDQAESDEYDAKSLHCLIVHHSGMPAGSVRLVPTEADATSDPLPFEKHCFESLDRAFIEGLNLDRVKACEISRLAVDGAFRRRTGENLTRFGEVASMDCTEAEKRTFSLIAVAAFLASTALTVLTGRTSVFAMMEPFLPRLLKRSGIVFHRAGSDIDYHGTRAPYFIHTQSALDNMHPELLELYDAVYKQVSKGYASKHL